MNIHHHLSAVLLVLLGFSGAPLSVEPDYYRQPETVTAFLHDNEDEESIPWGARRQLTWEDFQCEPRRNTDAVASTSTTLGISYQVKNNALNYHITCNFSKTKSWGLVKTDYILAHEQGHFDITEIYARRLYQALQDYRFNRRTYREDINEIYQEIVSGKEEMQAAYDRQSDHSRNKKQQREWLERIDQLLDETEHYAAYP